MADTVREKIIQAIVGRCATLTTEPVNRCYRSEIESNAKFVSVWDGDDTAAESKYGITDIRMHVGIEAIWVSADYTLASAEANAMIGEIIAAITGTDTTLGGYAQDITVAQSSPTYPETGSRATGVRVLFMVDYSYVTGDPYTLP